MALFSDTSIPPWLQPKREPWEALLEGQQVGNQIASNILRARSLQMQSAETTAQVGNIMASTELKNKQLEELNRENAAWLNEDDGTRKWLTQPYDPTAPLPTPHSQRAEAAIQSRLTLEERRQYHKELTDVQKERAANVLEAAKIHGANSAQAAKDAKDWSDSFWSLDKTIRQGIQKKIIDQDPKGLDENGIPTIKYRGLIDDALPPALKVGRKTPAGGSREVAFTYLQEKRDEALKAGDKKTADELEGRINRLSRASGVDEVKIISSIWEAKIKAIDKQLMDPAYSVEKAKKDKGVLARRKELISDRAETERQLLDAVASQSETPAAEPTAGSEKVGRFMVTPVP